MATQNGRSWSSGDIVTAANLSSIERGVSTLTEEYTPTTWANGDTVTAAALNNIEQGIVNAGGGSSDLNVAKMSIAVDGAGSSSVFGVKVSNIYTSISVDGGNANYYRANEGAVITYNNPDPYFNILIGSEPTVLYIDDVIAANMQEQPLTIGNIAFSGDAEIQTENGYSWVKIMGDCTMTITISDESSGGDR